MSSNSRRCPSPIRASATAWIIVVGVVLAAYASAGPQIAPPTPFTSQNDFLDAGVPLNGSVLVTSPVKDLLPPGLASHRSGTDPDGYIARARRLNPGADLGDFDIDYRMTERRHGAAAVLARGPVPTQLGNGLPPPHDTVSYVYVVGGRSTSGVSGTIERAEIDADGHIHPGQEVIDAGILRQRRYGAAAVASGEFLYVVGGYDGDGKPLDSIERFRINPSGELGDSAELTGPGWGGDVAAVVVNGHLYVIGGNTDPRGPDEGALRAVTRAAIGPDGALSDFEDLTADDALLPIGTAGGRAIVVAAWDSDMAAPVHYIYYLGGNVGNTINGATKNVYRLRVNNDNTIEGPWTSVPLGSGIVMLNDPRELFAAVVSNGYAWVIGGETTAMGSTTFYSTVERAEIFADGSIGGFQRLEQGARGTYINGLERDSDIGGVAFNNVIYVPGGRDGLGAALDVVFHLHLDGDLTDVAGPDTAIFSAVRDLEEDREIDSLWFDIEPDPASPGSILFRFRTAGDDWNGGPHWGAWSGYVAIDDLPVAVPGAGRPPFLGDRHLLDLSYEPGADTGCSQGMIANPTTLQGPLAARWIEYEVVMPRGGKDQRFNGMTINARPIVHFALPGGYDPRYTGQAHPPSCAPNHAIADAGAYGWVRFTGIGFPDVEYAGRFAILPLNPGAGAPIIVIQDAARPDSETIDLEVRVDDSKAKGGSWDYALVFDTDGDKDFSDEQPLLNPAMRVYPTPRIHGAPDPGLDILGNSTQNDNVVAAPSQSTGQVTFTVALRGTDFRSGRVNETGPVATSDPNAASYWPRNPKVGNQDQPNYLRYKVDDLTAEDGKFVDLKVANTAADTWRDVGPGELKDPGRFDITLEIDWRAKSGPHNLSITIESPQLGVTGTFVQTVHVVPALRVDTFKTHEDPTPDCPPGSCSENNYNWTDAHNPAVADLGDGVVIDVAGAGFMSDSGKPLIGTVASTTPRYAPGVAFNPNTDVTDRNNLHFHASVPGNAMPGRHDFDLAWKYQLGFGGSDDFDPSTQVPPVRHDTVVVDQTWHRQAGSWQLLFVVPPRVSVQSILGSSNTQNPIVLLQSDPTLTVNGSGFATGGPPPDFSFGSVLHEAKLVSMANSPDEDIVVPPSGMHMVSDCQARLSMQLTSNQRAGEMYQLEMQTLLDLPPTAKVGHPYTTAMGSQMVTVLPMPRCDSVSPPGQFLAVKQGQTLSGVTVYGKNFDDGARVLLGPGVTVQNLDVCTHLDPNTACPNQDRLTFDVAVDPLASPGRRPVEVEIGPTAALSQRATCSGTFDLWVVPVPGISAVQPGNILSPPASEGTRRVTVDVYGSNFVPGAKVSGIMPATGVSVAPGSDVFVNSGHVTVELDVDHAAVDTVYTLEISEPAGPAGMPDQKTTGTFTVGAFREIGISGVTQTTTQCQGRSGTMQVTGTNFKDPSGTDLVAGVSFGPDISVDSWQATSASSLTVNYSVSEGAALGSRPLRLDPVQPGGTPAVWSNALKVTSSPSIVAVSPQAVPTGGSRLVTISGRNFYEGGATVTIAPPTNLTVTGVSVINTGLIQALVTADGQATPDMRSIIVTNTDGGQCNVATLTSSFQVIPQMAIASVANQTSQCQGRSGALTVTGANFKDPMGSPLVGSASLGSDVSVDSMVINSATSLTINYVISDAAATGKRALTLSPMVQGAASAVWPNALTVTSSPSITSVSPQGFSPGDTKPITVTGRNFLAGADLAVSPAGSATLSAVSVVSSGQVLATLAVDPNAVPGPLTITLDNKDGACSVATLNAAINVADPPHVTNWRFKRGKLRIDGSNFHPSLQAYIGGSTTPYAYVNVRSNARVVIGRAKSVFPKGVPTTVRLVNPDDGGEYTFVATR